MSKRRLISRKLIRELGALRLERFRVLVHDTPLPLDRRIAAWFEASWGWLISAGVHAVITVFLMIFTTSSESNEPLVFYVSDAHSDSEHAQPMQLQQMSVAAPRRQSLPVALVAKAAVSESVAAVNPAVDSPDAHIGRLNRFGGPTDDARTLVESNRDLLNQLGQHSRGTEFFGIQATGKRFVFVVDSSRSMKWSKWRRACRELVAAIEKLGPDQSFCVYFFDSVPHLMFNQHPSDVKLIEATPQNILRVRRWMASVSFGNETRPYAAVHHALSLNPDAVFLLSDGEFHDATLEYFHSREMARKDDESSKPAIVHTIGFKTRVGQPALRQIADQTGGIYRFIP